MHLLVVEDDSAIGKSLVDGFADTGNTTEWVKDGEAGLERAVSGRFDALILDLMLPGLSGLDVLQRVREQGVRTPVLLLTAMSAIDQRVKGLRAGADDYVVKPFALDEVLARLEAICRRTLDRPAPQMTVGDTTLDLTTRRVTRGGEEIDLTPKEFSLLELLMRHAGHVVTRKMLCEHIWEGDWEGMTNLIEVHINRLRKKLDREGENPTIQTVRGRGYVYRSS
jgi:two-component system, OmpR family, response regulator